MSQQEQTAEATWFEVQQHLDCRKDVVSEAHLVKMLQYTAQHMWGQTCCKQQCDGRLVGQPGSLLR